VLRIPDDEMRELHNECTNMTENESLSGKNKLKVGVSWTQVVDDSVFAIPTIEFKFLHQHLTARKLRTPH